jgi:hypothetical protein
MNKILCFFRTRYQWHCELQEMRNRAANLASNLTRLDELTDELLASLRDRDQRIRSLQDQLDARNREIAGLRESIPVIVQEGIRAVRDGIK